MDTWKTRFGPIWHIIDSGISAAGRFNLHVQEPLKCYRLKVTKGHTGDPCLAPFGESNLPPHFHTYTRSTCKFWWHSGAPGVIPPLKRLSVSPGWSSPLDFSARGSTNVIFNMFRVFKSMETCKTRVGTI